MHAAADISLAYVTVVVVVSIGAGVLFGYGSLTYIALTVDHRINMGGVTCHSEAEGTALAVAGAVSVVVLMLAAADKRSAGRIIAFKVGINVSAGMVISGLVYAAFVLVVLIVIVNIASAGDKGYGKREYESESKN